MFLSCSLHNCCVVLQPHLLSVETNTSCGYDCIPAMHPTASLVQSLTMAGQDISPALYELAMSDPRFSKGVRCQLCSAWLLMLCRCPRTVADKCNSKR